MDMRTAKAIFDEYWDKNYNMTQIINEARKETIIECAEVAREQGTLGYHEYTEPSILKLIEQVK